MADITTRAGKGAPLTNDELDANFVNLNTDKAENGANSDITSLSGITGGVSTVDYVDFDALASVIRATGRLTWNNEEGCLEVGLLGSDVTQQIGQEVVTRAYNADSVTIANGEVAYFWSTSGQIVSCQRFIANGTINTDLVIGVATEDIAAGSYGYITEFGLVRGLDTATFNPGDVVYASPISAGQLTTTKPSSPNDVVVIGICLQSDSTDGIILVKPHEIPEAEEIRYDNGDSNLVATNVKSALDELDLVKANIDLLTSNVTFYLTSANDAVIVGYKQLVTSTLDTNFDEIAVDYLTASISTSFTMLQAWVSDVNVLVGDIAGIVIPIVGNVRKDTGAGDARFYFEVYIRDDLGTETLLTTSNTSDYITSTSYLQISLSATLSLQTFTDTDQVVIKLYGQTLNNTATYELQLGGSQPFRSLFPVPVSVVPSVANAYAIVADTTNFDGQLSSADDTVQKALETLDNHTHNLSDITGLTASNVTATTTGFNGLLSVTETDVQKALNVLDDTDLQAVTGVGATTTNAITINNLLNVDNIRIDGNAITSTDLNGNIALTPNGTGEVDITKVDIDGGAIDGTVIGATVAAAGNFTALDVSASASFAGATIDDLGTVTTADINGGTIDGVDLSATIADIDNIRIDANTISSTNGNGDINLTPNGLGNVVISSVDINAGAIDGTTIGGTTSAAGTFAGLTATGTISFTGATVSDLGSVTTADINGGTIDGADITVGSGKTLNVTNGTLTLADDQISGSKVHGGVISEFTSTGIDDNATAEALELTRGRVRVLSDALADHIAYVEGRDDTNATSLGYLQLGAVAGELSGVYGTGGFAFGATPSTATFVIDSSGNVTTVGTVDGRDVATDGTKLDGIQAGATAYGNADVDTHINQSTATASQVLSWSGTDYAWVDASAVTNLTDLSDVDNSFAGKTLTETSTSVTATVGQRVSVDTAGQTITLPATPSNGDIVGIVVGNFTDTTVARNGSTIMDLAEDLTIDTAYASVDLMYITDTWRIV